MTALLWLTWAAAWDPEWTKPEGEIPALTDEPRISCCGFDRDRWRSTVQSVLPQVRECVPTVRPEDLKIRTKLTIPANELSIRAEVTSADAPYASCVEAALETATWDGEVLPCTVIVSYPFVFAATDPDRGHDAKPEPAVRQDGR